MAQPHAPQPGVPHVLMLLKTAACFLGMSRLSAGPWLAAGIWLPALGHRMLHQLCATTRPCSPVLMGSGRAGSGPWRETALE